MRTVAFHGLGRSPHHWHLHALNPDAWQGQFLRMRAADYRRHVFLDERLKSHSQPVIAALPTTETAWPGSLLPVHFVFHIAFCGSTLLTRGLEAGGHALILREPLALLQIAETVRRHGARWQGARLARLIRVTLSCLSRGFEGHRSVVIKPSNIVTALAPSLMVDPRSRALLMTQGLRGFLISCAKKGADTQARMLQLPHRLLQCAGLGAAAGQYPVQDIDGDPLRAAALSWLIQMHWLCGLIQSPLASRVATVDFDAFLRRPQSAAADAAGWFGLEPPATLDWLHRHAKEPTVPYGPADRDREAILMATYLGSRLRRTADWLDRHCPGQAAACWRRVRAVTVADRSPDEERSSAPGVLRQMSA